MQRADFLSFAAKSLTALALSTTLLPLAHAADKVRLGVFPSSAALPFYIAQNRGYFQAAGLEVEEIPMTSHPLTVQSIVAGNIDGAANLVTLEGANIEARRPNTLKYLSLNGQNSEHMIEQFVVKASHPAKSLKDFKGGIKLFSAPGPANIGAARAVLKKLGLTEGSDFTIQEQPISMHASVLQAGTFDGGYTLEPAATIMIGQKIGKRVEAGVIATHLMGNKSASAFAAGAVLSDKFVSENPDVAKRFAEAWARGVKEAQSDNSTRGYLVAGMKVPPALAAIVPLPRIVMAKDLSAADMDDFQKFLDLGVEFGVVKEKMDAKILLKTF